MDGQLPLSVTAVTKQIKKDIYPHVEDDATILLEYPKAVGIIEASWNWPFNIKDMELFGETGYVQAVNGSTLRIKEQEGQDYQIRTAIPLAKTQSGYLQYLSAVLRKEIVPENDLSSLENNLIVVKILEAAKGSARTGKKVVF